MQLTPTHKTEPRSTKGLAGKFAVATLLALITPTHFVFAASIWDNITNWGKGALSAVADFGMDLLLTPIVWIAHFINSAANLFMLGMGYMLDQSISYTLDSSIYKSVSAIQVGWTAVRDFSNMFFIFILLYIAIITILGMAKSSTKTLVAHVIISALLINFSLFFTQVVIDAGNILALGFWNKMITQQGTVSGPSASAFFMEGFRVQTEFDSVTDGTGAKVKITKSTEIMIYLGGAAVSFVAGYVFLAGAVMMIIRSVTLMILMITSPFAFLSFGLPKRGEFWGKWTGQLVGATFMAPAFIFMLYIDMLIIRGTGTGGELIKASGADTGKFALAFAGQVTNFSVIYNFVLMIVLLLAALTVANSVSSGAGSQAGGWAKKLIGGGAAMGAVGVAMAGRQTAGNLGNRAMQNEKWVREQNRLVAKGSMVGANRWETIKNQANARAASAKLATAQSMSKGTFDVRNAKVKGVGINSVLGATGTGVNVGQGGTKSFESGGEAFSALTGRYRGTEKEKELLATAKARFPNDAAAQRAYVERKGVEIEKMDGQVDRNKAVREDFNKGIAADAEKLHPGDREAQKAYIMDNLRNEVVTERQHLKDAQGNLQFDGEGQAIYGDMKVMKNVWDTPAMKEQRMKLETQVTTQVTQQAIQSAIDALNNPNFAKLPPAQQAKIQTQSSLAIQRYTTSATPQALAQMKESYLQDPNVIKHMNAAQLRAVVANQDVGDGTLTKMQEQAYKNAEAAASAGEDPNQAVPTLDLFLNARQDSRLNTNPQETARLKTLIAEKKQVQQDASAAAKKAADAAAKKTKDSDRFRELFGKTNLSAAEEQELKDLRSA